MLRSFRHMVVATMALAVAAFNSNIQSVAAGDSLCALAPGSYTAAKSAYPDAGFAIAALEQHTIATWYTDRGGDYASTAKQLVAQCSGDSRLSVVVYGLPNKDCDAGYSSGGLNKNAGDYVNYLNTLTGIIGSRKVLYVLEPDAVGLLAKTGGCAESNGYKANLQTAVKMLSANPNAEIYLDVGYWTLQSGDSASQVAKIVKDIASAGRVKGITLNTSNFRSNSELTALCGNFQSAIGDYSMHCVFDTSRNYNGSPSSNEWCNTKQAGIGKPPTSDTGLSNVDYFIWIKPPGESDGTCDGSDRTSDALKGPAAGSFFKESFKLLWNQGALVKELGQPVIDGTIRQYSDSSSTPAPATTAPPATYAPATEAPATATPTPVATDSPTQENREAADSSASSNSSDLTQSANTTSPSSASAAGSAAGDSTTAGSANGLVANESDNAGVATVAPADSTDATTTTSAPVTDAGSAQQVTTKTSTESSMSSGVIVLFVMLAAAVVALVAVVGLRRRQQKLLFEAKTPTEPHPTFQITTVKASESSVL
ncbi:Glycoside hydrolase, partial [Globisporangium splendens]